MKLRPGADAEGINAALPAWERRRIPDESRDPGDDRSDYGLRLTNVRDVHLGATRTRDSARATTEGTVATFAVIALLILGVACVNFTNLATARATQAGARGRLRKVLGASRKQLVIVPQRSRCSRRSPPSRLAAVELLLPVLELPRCRS